MRCIDQSCASETYPELSPHPLLLISTCVGGIFVVVPRFGRLSVPLVRDNAGVKVPAHKTQDVVGVA